MPRCKLNKVFESHRPSAVTPDLLTSLTNKMLALVTVAIRVTFDCFIDHNHNMLLANNVLNNMYILRFTL